jgi:putative ABC transport system ATP-binding protein
MAQALADEAVEKGERLKRDGIVIRTYDIWKTYTMGDQVINAVSGVDMEIKRGEYVAIMGPSGSGKSTLMNLIGCLDTPSKGEYYINGRLVSEMSWRPFAIKRSASSSRHSTCCPAPARCTMWSCL